MKSKEYEGENDQLYDAAEMSSKMRTELLDGFGNLVVISDLDSYSCFLYANHNLAFPTPVHFKRNC